MSGAGHDPAVLDKLCPMHLLLSASGRIRHAGPTIQKLRSQAPLAGRRFLDTVTVKRPRGIAGMEDLRRAAGVKLHLAFRDAPRTELKGLLVPLGDRRLIVNLSFGISIFDGVQDYALTNADFAATDLAIEMLYLMEAKSAAMEASRRLNLRLQEARIAAEEQAFTDTLTGLKNRRALNAVLERLITAGEGFAVMHVDLDYFKAVNDRLGHAAGDHVLQVVAHIMQQETRSSDMVVRLGGDEFTVVLPDVRSEGILRGIGQRIIDRLEEPIHFKGEVCKVSASIGTVWIQRGDRRSRDVVLANADAALYASKHAGRARHTFFYPTLRAGGGMVAAPAEKGSG
ncbi:diguanylate cyclase domain-containing protein [Sulfitobacter sp. 1A12779]|uniref:diguanylate cyclase domain-containing protein n=1 Tax=Sulfitobacter sp. 1A12779 TaxID=3368599 RepID=UPI003746155A